LEIGGPRRRRRRRGRGGHGGGGHGAQNQPHPPHGSHHGYHQGQPRPQNNGQAHRDPQGLPPLPPGVKPWDQLTVIDPAPRITLEYPGCPASCRLIDLFCPIGRGQRALIVSPPKAGKTTLLKDIALATLRNHPALELVVLLIDERPEEVTDFRRTLAAHEERLAADVAWAQNAAKDLGLHQPTDPAAHATPAQGTMPLVGGFGVQHVSPRCTIIASSNDHGTDKHVEVALKAAEYGKRRVELGKHVVILLDSLTRLGRAFNQSRKHASSGRIMTGGLDSKALEVPRQIFGSARNTEEAGSLTIIASCLVDTGSAADQIIFEEFKGSGNMELILDRKIAERRLFPAINLAESGTRKEEKMMSEAEVKTMTALRRRLLQMPPHLQVEQLLAALTRFPTNASLVGGAG
jgi:transcription termination factor Rho